MKRKLLQSNLIIFTLMLFCVTCFNTFAQQTKKISLQGFLKDANGKAVPDSKKYEITFKLYATPTGGTPAWTEVTTVDVTGGVYSTYLGSTPSNPIDGLSWGTSTYHVGVTIGGVELTPRTELTFAPYSLGSPFAEKANYVVCSGAIGDVKYSILNPQQFAAVNGNCWVPMDGGNMSGSKLAAIIGGSTVPNAGGLFLRGQPSQNGATNYDPERSPGSAIAQIQQDDYKYHFHSYSSTVSINGTTASGGDYSMVFANQKFVPNGDAGSAYALTPYPTLGETHTKTVPSHSHTFSASGTASGNSNNSGGNETRPKNLNLWTYIRIN